MGVVAPDMIAQSHWCKTNFEDDLTYLSITTGTTGIPDKRYDAIRESEDRHSAFARFHSWIQLESSGEP